MVVKRLENLDVLAVIKPIFMLLRLSLDFLDYSFDLEIFMDDTFF